MKKRVVTAACAAVLGVGVAAGLMAVPASAASTPVVSNTVAIPLTRIVDTPGLALANGQTKGIHVAGVDGIPDNATAVEGFLTTYLDTGVSRVSLETSGTGAPGTPTVIGFTTTAAQPSGASATFHVALGADGNVDVHDVGARTSILFAVTGYDIPAPATPLPDQVIPVTGSHADTDHGSWIGGVPLKLGIAEGQNSELFAVGLGDGNPDESSGSPFLEKGHTYRLDEDVRFHTREHTFGQPQAYGSVNIIFSPADGSPLTNLAGRNGVPLIQEAADTETTMDTDVQISVTFVAPTDGDFLTWAGGGLINQADDSTHYEAAIAPGSTLTELNNVNP